MVVAWQYTDIRVFGTRDLYLWGVLHREPYSVHERPVLLELGLSILLEDLSTFYISVRQWVPYSLLQ